MNINKDTAKAVNAAKTLIKYCARYKDCQNCVFFRKRKFDFDNDHCANLGPFKFLTIDSPFEKKGFEKKGAQNE